MRATSVEIIWFNALGLCEAARSLTLPATTHRVCGHRAVDLACAQRPNLGNMTEGGQDPEKGYDAKLQGEGAYPQAAIVNGWIVTLATCPRHITADITPTG